MKPLTKKDMYDEEGKSLLLKGIVKKNEPRSKYDPHLEDLKHKNERSKK